MIETILLKRYRIETLLGQGGMGAVYRAYDERLERNVAIKVLNNDDLGTQGRARLLQEARAVARLNHPNIVSVYDADEEGKVSFVVMELINGKTLREQKPANLREIVFIARQICKALEHAHNQGIVHRDLKPENIMLVGLQVKLMDFGLARSIRGEQLDQDGLLVGTPAYIAPEQIKDDAADARSDLYSLGIILYELVTGDVPFTGNSLYSIISKHLNTLPVPPTHIKPDLTFEMEALILKLLAKNPEERYQSVGQVLVELESLHPGLDTAAAPRATNNLPADITTFIGRDHEVDEIERLVGSSRLVTLTGSGGIGKTRLSLHVASRLVDSFTDGVWLVELAPLADPEMVPYTVAKALGLSDEMQRSMTEKLCEYFSDRAALLVLDNCEHLMDACATLSDLLLRAAPRLKILASSREALGIAGEVSYRVPSLSLPRENGLLPEELLQFESIRLFVERARAVSPGFALGPENAEVIAQVCRRLDGIPLALELAAARVNILNVEQIAIRLDDRFRLLTGGSRTALPRQQTLRAMIDWSWDLLSDSERALLRGVSVFADGWGLESAEAVCSGLRVDETTVIQAEDVLDLLTQLVHKSLVLAEQDELGEMRYRLLESIRQYAREKLWDAGQGEQIRDRHLAHFCQMTVLAEAELYSPRQVYWHRRLSIEMENFRAALDWGQERDVPAALQIVTALERTWEDYSIQEEINWLKTLMARAEQLEDALSVRAKGWRALSDTQTWMNDIEESYHCGMKSLELARQAGDFVNQVLALESLAFCCWLMGDKANGLVFAQQALEVSRANHDKRGEIEALYVLGMNSNDNYEYARDCYEQSMAICCELGHLLGEASRFDDLATLASEHGDYDQAYVWWQESIRVFAEAGMPNQGHLYTNLASLQIRQGDYQAAYKNLQVSIAMNREKGVTILLQWSVARMAQVLVHLGDYELANKYFVESLHFLKRSKDIAPIYSVLTVEGLACLYANVGRFAEALAFYTWADTERQTLNDTRPPDEQVVVDADMQKIRAGLTDVEFAAAEAQGKALTREQAIALAYQGV